MQQSPEILMEMCRKVVGDSLGYNFCANPICDMLFELYTAARDERSIYLWSLASRPLIGIIESSELCGSARSFRTVMRPCWTA